MIRTSFPSLHANPSNRPMILLPWFAVLAVAVSSAPGQSLDMAALKALDPAGGRTDEKAKLIWYDAKGLTVEGKGWEETADTYFRLPARAKDTVRKPVWSLSTSSAGVAVRFVADSDRIAARWTLTSKRLAMNHMPATGVSGVDLYVRDEGRWKWIGIGRPTSATTNQSTLASDIPAGPHEFLLYLPLYNGTKQLEIGIAPKAKLAPAPARPAEKAKPIVYYGTSIAQGGCASRPGMAHPAILGRWLDRPVINLGFSGNGKMEMELCALIAEIDAAAYVLDCLPNLKPEEVRERTEPFVLALREARPDTPIVLVENIAYQEGYFLPRHRESYQAKNRALRAAYEELRAKDVQGLTSVPGDTLLGTDGEATVDGTHCTDLGFYRFAKALEPVLRDVLRRR